MSSCVFYAKRANRGVKIGRQSRQHHTNPVQAYILKTLQRSEDHGDPISPQLMTLTTGTSGGQQRHLHRGCPTGEFSS